MADLLHEKDFTMEKYDEFYGHHYFKPMPPELAINAHRVLPRVDWALDIAELRTPKKILDLGCLDGFAGLTLANNCKSIKKLVGVDLSQEGIDIATSRGGLVKVNTEFHKDTIEHYLENATEEFDLIMLFEVLEHVKDPERLLELIDTAKAPDGVVLISTPAFESPTFGKNDVKNKCHIRLFTTKEENYEEMTDASDPDTGKPYMRTATSLPKLLGKRYIIDMRVYSELINCIYT